MMNSKLLLLSLCLTLSCFLATDRGFAQGQPINDLSVLPNRATLEDSSHGTTFTLLNRGSKPMRYRLTFQDMQMNGDGALEKVADYDHSAMPYLRVWPREVFIQPGEWQKIKIVASLPDGLAKGEYRSHLLFQPVDVTEGSSSDAAGRPRDLKIQLRMQTAFTVPLFVRHGSLAGSATISGVAPATGPGGENGLAFQLNRQGDRTVRGDCTVTFVPANAGRRTEVGRILELPVYFPNIKRNVFVALDKSPAELGKGEFIVRFSEPGSPAIEARLARP